MSLSLEFEPDFQNKILYMRFASQTVFHSSQDFVEWKAQWMKALQAWHSPYKAAIDFSQVEIALPRSEFAKSLENLLIFFQKFFLRKSVLWGLNSQEGLENLPCEWALNEEQALVLLGVRERSTRAKAGDFRSLIHIDNHFEQQNVELSFLDHAVLNREAVKILRSKLSNNLMLWHSQWTLLIDCSHLEIPEDAWEDFAGMVRFLKRFFLKDLVGYSPLSKDHKYPFPVYRSRHKAAAQLKGTGQQSGRDAYCRSQKKDS